MTKLVQRGPVGSHQHSSHSRWYRAWHVVYDPLARAGASVEHGAAGATRFIGSQAGEIALDVALAPVGPAVEAARLGLHYAAHHGRTGYVCRAAHRSISYASSEIERNIGREAWAAVKGFVDFVLKATEIELGCIAAGTLVGGILTIEVGGEGAVVGAEVGEFVGELIVKSMGLGYLIKYIKSALAEIGHWFRAGVSTAWHSRGASSRIDLAARQLGHGEALLVFAILQGIINALLEKAKGAAGEKLAGKLAEKPGGREAMKWAEGEASLRIDSMGESIDASSAPRTNGMTSAHFSEFAARAKLEQAYIVVSDTNLKATGWIEKGYPPKPMSIKAHTSSETGVVTAVNGTELKQAFRADYLVVDSNNQVRNAAGKVFEIPGGAGWPLRPGQIIDPQLLKPLVADYDVTGVIKPDNPGQIAALALTDRRDAPRVVQNRTNPYFEKVTRGLPRVMHGAQDLYAGHRTEGGATAFCPDGTVRHLRTPAEVSALYDHFGRKTAAEAYPQGPLPKGPLPSNVIPVDFSSRKRL